MEEESHGAQLSMGAGGVGEVEVEEIEEASAHNQHGREWSEDINRIPKLISSTSLVVRKTGLLALLSFCLSA